MGCNCGKKRTYEVTRGDGTKATVSSLTEAMNMVRRMGGYYKVVLA